MNPPKHLKDLMVSFVLFCPSRIYKKDIGYMPVSKQGHLFASRGINKNLFQTLLSKIKQRFVSPNGNLCFKVVQSSDIEKEVDNILLSAGADVQKVEYFVGNLSKPKMCKTEFVFYYIRCAFAHGDFSYKNGFWSLLTYGNKKINLKARLKTETLLYLADLIDVTKEQILAMRNKQTSKKRKA